MTGESGVQAHRRRGVGWGKRRGSRGEALGGLGAREEDRSKGVDGERWLAELGYGGGVVPVGIGRGEGGCELCKVTAELARGSARAEELR